MSHKKYLLALAAVFLLSLPLAAGDPGPYRSPIDLAFSADGRILAVSDRTAASVALVDTGAAEPRLLRQVALRGQPTGVAWSGGKTLLVAEYDAGTVAEIAVPSGKVLRRLEVGLRPMGLAIAKSRRLLVAANTVTDDVSLVDLQSGEERARLRVPREPFFVAVTPNEKLAVIGNLLPAGSATNPSLAAVVSLIDLENLKSVANIPLPAGSTSVREVLVSPDGQWAYTVHTVGRFNVPATQLERGWVNTHALSVLDLRAKRHHATVLLDQPYQGAADPWGLAISGDGNTLWISLRGVHRLARVDLRGLHSLLEGKLPEALASREIVGASVQNIWLEIQKEPARRKLLVNDLSALYSADLIEKFPVRGKGPRGIDLSPDGKRLAVAAYYSGEVAFVDTASGKVTGSLALGQPREPDLVRRGEILFHDATLCFQQWMSCSTCHPDEARTDGLHWDLLNDGLGTPQRTRSLLMTHKFERTTARGVRGGIEESVAKGLLFFLHPPEPKLVEELVAYLSSLEPEPSPHLVNGKLSDSARRGKKLFNGKARCGKCHPPELGSDMKPHDIGSRGEFDRPGDVFYTPKLLELYRTAPFLHDGRAATLEELFTIHDPKRGHGRASRLSAEELADLVEYLKSL